MTTEQSAGRSFSSENEAELASQIEAWLTAIRPDLGAILMNRGVIADVHLDYARTQAELTGRSVGEILREQGYIDDHQLASAVGEQLNVVFVDLRDAVPSPEALAKVGEEMARKHHVLPMWMEEDRVYVVSADPLDELAIRELTTHCERIGLLVGVRSEIDRLLDRVYNALTEADVHIQAFALSDDTPQEIADAAGPQVDDNAPVVQVVNRIVTQGVRNRASDIHIEAHERSVKVRYRIDGALSEALELPSRMSSPISSRIKVLADLNIVERRRPQDGQFSMQVDGRPIDVRTSIVSTIHGEKIVLRLLDKTRSLIGLSELGMPEGTIDTYLSIVKAPVGMLLCTGPTGSGKTTTLYATLTEVDDDTKNVITIEDPVEYQFDGINQMQVSEAAGITFADGLRGVLRQDPDVILVGEIRDVETARIATQASLTGHFVLSSLHAVDAVAAVHRFIDMGVEPFLVASAISGVIGQRLLRIICTSCKSPYTPSSSEVRAVRNSTGSVPDVWYKGTGCNVCNGSGYRGRQGVYELLQIDDTIRDLIVARAQHSEMRAAAIEGGMRTMQEEAFRMVVNGLTTVDEVLRAVYAPSVDRNDNRPMLALDSGPRAIDRSTTGELGVVEVNAIEESA